MIEDATCPHCLGGEQDEIHMFWTCPALAMAEDEDISSSNSYKRRVLRYDDETRTEVCACPCWWLRGIVPRTWTWRAPIEEEITHDIGDPSSIDDSYSIFLDGSGGSKSADKRIRSYGWAWTAGNDPDTKGQYGTLTGRQTVPRAEAQALLKFMQFAVERLP